MLILYILKFKKNLDHSIETSPGIILFFIKIPKGYSYFESSPGLMAIILLSITAMAPLVAALTKSL